MTIDEYLAALAQTIRSLPPAEADQAVAYYFEYLHDAADPDAAMAELGTPRELASTILAGYVAKQPTRSPKLNLTWAVALGILAAPVAAPVAISAFVVVLALLIVTIVVICALVATGIAILVSGVALAVTGIITVVAHLATGLSLLGTGLAATALGLVWLFGIISLGRLSLSGITRLGAKFTRRQS